MSTRRKLAGSLAALGMTLSGAALAQQPTTPYIGILGGAEYLRDADNTGGGVTLTSSYKTGYNVGLVAGEDLGNNWRFEGEFDYRRSDLDKLRLSDVTALGLGAYNGMTVAATGHVRTMDLMANGWYDLPVGGGWKPYVGGGLGVANVKLSNVGFAGQPAFIDDSGNFLAYQLGAGLGYDITPTTTVSVDYRYFGTANPTFTMMDGTSFDSEARGNNVDLSLRYRF